MKKKILVILSIVFTLAINAFAQNEIQDRYFAQNHVAWYIPENFDWSNPMQQGFNVVQGQGWHEGNYQRLPAKAKGVVRQPVWNLSTNSTGLNIVFRTDAPDIMIRYGVNGLLQMDHMAATGVSGVDLYGYDVDGNMRWFGETNKRAFGDTIKYFYSNIAYHNCKKYGYEYHLYLPLYNGVKWLEIGVTKGHTITYAPATSEQPIVIYGTSITQGACASRPGMAWTNIIQRESGHEIINLGFSGNGEVEKEIFDLMSEINAKMWVIDCMPNMDGCNEALICDRIMQGVHILRAKSNAPILLIEHLGFAHEMTSDMWSKRYQGTNKELKRAYRKLLAEGVEDVYLLDHSQNAIGMDDMVEGWHPTDLGMRHIATSTWKKMREVLGENGSDSTVFTPVVQQRDTYDWRARHEEVLRLNKEEQPEILLVGNSITHFWGGTPYNDSIHRGEDSWNKLFKKKKVRNMGFGWDRIENVLWRFYHGELDGYNAKKVFLMIGTNNLKYNTNEEIVAGVNELVSIIRDRQPQAKVYVSGIMPRKGQESRVAEYNRLLQSKLSKDVSYVDFTPAFVLQDGTINPDYFESDGLHPNKKGYQQQAKVLKPFVNEK